MDAVLNACIWHYEAISKGKSWWKCTNSFCVTLWYVLIVKKPRLGIKGEGLLEESNVFSSLVLEEMVIIYNSELGWRGAPSADDGLFISGIQRWVDSQDRGNLAVPMSCVFWSWVAQLIVRFKKTGSISRSGWLLNHRVLTNGDFWMKNTSLLWIAEVSAEFLWDFARYS